MTEHSSSSQEESASPVSTTSNMRGWDPSWPAADIVVLPGLPGWRGPGSDRDIANPYPSSTPDFVKALCNEGLHIQYTVSRDDRSTISLKSAELWVPILVFALQDMTQVPSEILTTAILKVFGRWLSDDSRLHVHFMQKNADGSTHEFKANGKAREVLQAIRLFGETHRVAKDPEP